MGRNADKRKARKHIGSGEGPAESDAGVNGPTTAHALAPPGAMSTGAVKTAASPTLEPPLWARRMAAAPVEVPADDDGTLAHALFQITCQLSVRDARGVMPRSFERVAAEIARVVDADTVSLMRLELGDADLVPTRLVLLGSHGLAIGDTGLVSFDVGDGVAGRVALTGEAVCIEDAPRDARFQRLYGQRTEIGSLMSVPLRYGARVLGVLTASRREIRGFQKIDEERLRVVADWVAQDLEHGRLFYEAVTDPLTGMFSRFALLHALPREVETARRYQTQISIVVLDLDDLAGINARHGRAAGDRVLVETGKRLLATVRSADLAVRFGGDEVAVLLPMTPANQAKATAKRLVRLLSTSIPGVDAPLRWSAGVSTIAAHLDEDGWGMLARADRALAEAKAQGGDTIVVAPMERKGTSD